jgi:hypothetical protein
MGQINTNNYPIVDSLADTDLLIVENATHGTGTTTPKQLRENAIGTDPLQTTAQTVTGAINELKNSSGLPETPLAIIHGGTGNTVGYIQTGVLSGSTVGTNATIEGTENTASGVVSHAEGYQNTATQYSSHAEGYKNTASGLYAHAEGRNNTASGAGSHAEGYNNTASGTYSHAGGEYNKAGYNEQAVIGRYNNNKSSTLFEVGNGTGSSARSNAFEVYDDGKISCDNGSSKFKFTQSGGADGYYDASGTFHAFGSGGSGDTISKYLYTVNYANWSSSPNSDGYYTNAITLTHGLNTSIAPTITLGGSAYTSQPIDLHKTMFSYVERCYLSGGTLTLYAKTKPTSTFYVYIEGVAGSGSGSIVGNVIQPNGAVSGGGSGYKVITTKEITKSSMTYDSDSGVYYNPTNEFTASERSAIFGADLIGVYVYSEDSSNAKSWGDAVFSFKAITSGLHIYQIINDGAVANPHSAVGDIRIMIHGDSSTHLYYQILLKQTLYDYFASGSKFVIKVVKIA